MPAVQRAQRRDAVVNVRDGEEPWEARRSVSKREEQTALKASRALAPRERIMAGNKAGEAGEEERYGERADAIKRREREEGMRRRREAGGEERRRVVDTRAAMHAVELRGFSQATSRCTSCASNERKFSSLLWIRLWV